MRAEICHNQDDVYRLYYYKQSTTPIPTEFPCVMAEEDNDGGLMGQYYSYKFYYAPIEYGKKEAMAWMDGFIKAISIVGFL